MGLQTEREKEIQKNYFKICSKKFETDELEVLKKIYKELGSRSGSSYIDKETFLQFFPLPGLWGERLFLKFNFKNTGYIDFEEFIIGIAICCRGTKSDKINVLFDIFDLNSDGYIQKSEMVAMLSNIPYIHKLKNVFFNKDKRNAYEEECNDNHMSNDMNGEENNINICNKCAKQKNNIVCANNSLNNKELSNNIEIEETREYENYINNTSTEKYKDNFLNYDKKSKKEKLKFSKKNSNYKSESDDSIASSSSSTTSMFINSSYYLNNYKKCYKCEAKKNVLKSPSKHKTVNNTNTSSSTDNYTSNETSSVLNCVDHNSFSSDSEHSDLLSIYSSNSFISVYGYLIKNKKRQKGKKRNKEKVMEKRKAKCKEKEEEDDKEKEEEGEDNEDIISSNITSDFIESYEGTNEEAEDDDEEETRTRKIERKNTKKESQKEKNNAEAMKRRKEKKKIREFYKRGNDVVNIYKKENKKENKKKLNEYCLPSKTARNILNDEENKELSEKNIDIDEIVDIMLEECEFLDNDQITLIQFKSIIYKYNFFLYIFFNCLHEDIWGLQGNVLYGRDYVSNFVIESENFKNNEIKESEEVITEELYFKIRQLFITQAPDYDCVNDNLRVNFLNKKYMVKEESEKREALFASDYEKEKSELVNKKKIKSENGVKLSNNKVKNNEHLRSCDEEVEETTEVSKVKRNVCHQHNNASFEKTIDNLKNQVINIREKKELLKNEEEEYCTNEIYSNKNEKNDSNINLTNENVSANGVHNVVINTSNVIKEKGNLLNKKEHNSENANFVSDENNLQHEKVREVDLNTTINSCYKIQKDDDIEQKNCINVKNNTDIIPNVNESINKVLQNNINEIYKVKTNDRNHNMHDSVDDNNTIQKKSIYECDFNLFTNSLNDIFSKEIVEFIQASKISFNINDVCKERNLKSKFKYKKTKRNIDKNKNYQNNYLNDYKIKKSLNDKAFSNANMKNSTILKCNEASEFAKRSEKEVMEIENDLMKYSQEEITKDNPNFKNKIYEDINKDKLNNSSNNSHLIDDENHKEYVKDVNVSTNTNLLEKCMKHNVKLHASEKGIVSSHENLDVSVDSSSPRKVNQKEEGETSSQVSSNYSAGNENANKKKSAIAKADASANQSRELTRKMRKEKNSSPEERNSKENENDATKKKHDSIKKHELTKKHAKDINLYSCPNCKGPFLMCPNCHGRYSRFCVNNNKIAMECEYCDCEDGYFYSCIYCNFDFQKCLDMIKKNSLKEGILYKIGKHLHQFKARYYILFDNLLYYYDKKRNLKPRGFMFLEGCYVEIISKNEHINKFGFSICHKGTKQVQKRNLYVNSYEEREEWLQALYSSTKQNTLYDLYELHEQLGQGKFSTVYRGINKQTNSEFAIKVIDKRSVSIYEKELLRSEISILRLLRHPNVIYLKEIINTKEMLYISMELVKGGELYDFLLSETRLSEIHANKIITQLIKTVAYLHRCGIIHRDIKLENILLTDKSRDAQIKLTDFGLSTLCAPNELLKEPCGTLAYVAPEVITLQGYNHKADAWSIGVILYLLLSGKIPFPINKNTEMNIHKNYNLKFKDPIWKIISSSAKDLISKLLELNVDKRISANEALEHIWIKNPTAVINENSIIFKNEEINVLNLQDVSVSTFTIPKYTQFYIDEKKDTDENENKSIFNYCQNEIECKDDNSSDDPVIPLPYSCAL